MVKKKSKYNQNSQIRSALRRTFSRSPIVREILNSARIEYDQYKKDGTIAKRKAVRYKCAICGKEFKSSEVSVDHIIPVIPVNSEFDGWDNFIERLFCDKDNLQVVCSYKLKDRNKHEGRSSCHHIKTQEERRQRKETEKMRKI